MAVGGDQDQQTRLYRAPLPRKKLASGNLRGQSPSCKAVHTMIYSDLPYCSLILVTVPEPDDRGADTSLIANEQM